MSIEDKLHSLQIKLFERRRKAYEQYRRFEHSPCGTYNQWFAMHNQLNVIIDEINTILKEDDNNG